MAEYSVDNFQRRPLIYNELPVRRCTVAMQNLVTFFLTSCGKCLWDVVGHFLGCLEHPLWPGLSGGLRRFSSNQPWARFIYFK